MTPAAPPPDQAPAPARPRVLVVDDNESNRYLLESLLTAHGYGVDSAADGRAALELARAARPELVVADILMPVMDGFALCRAWQLDDGLRPVPFVFYTATYTGPRDRQFGLDLGAVDYVVKPEEPDALIRRLAAALEGRRVQPPAVQPAVREATFLREYNEALIHKLEDKMAELEAANRDLEIEVAQRRVSEARLTEKTRLLDMASDAIISLETDGRVRSWNRGATRLFGCPAEDRVGTPWPDAFGPFPAPIQALLAGTGHAEWAGELTLPTRAGPTVTVDSRWTLVQDAAATARWLLVVCTDVTARKALEEQVLRSQRMEVIGTMASGVAHDLNNILTPLVVAVPMLREAGVGTRALGLLQAIEASAERASGVLRQLLEFGRGRRSGDRLPVDAGAIVREVADLVAETFPRQVRVACRVGADLPPVLGDATQLHQLLLNLCVNARDAMPGGGTLDLTAEAVGLGTVRLGVSDTGTGIAPEIVAKIFDPFFTTKEVGRGTGLGLATVQSIAASHGGTVAVRSRLGEGTHFDIDLPAAAGPGTAPNPDATRPPAPGTAVLVVDDDPAILEVARAVLEQQGYGVLTASGLGEAVALAADPHNAVGTVLADLVMPGVQGFELFERLREAAPTAKLVAVSGLTHGPLGEGLTAVGVAVVLAKPFTGAQLLAAVRGEPEA